jgi:hypothetical protein
MFNFTPTREPSPEKRFGRDGTSQTEIPPRKAITSLRREWPTNNLIRESYLERIVALNALNRLMTYICVVAAADSNVDLLFRGAARAFHRHCNIVRVRHSWVLGWHSTTHGQRPYRTIT